MKLPPILLIAGILSLPACNNGSLLEGSFDESDCPPSLEEHLEPKTHEDHDHEEGSDTEAEPDPCEPETLEEEIQE